MVTPLIGLGLVAEDKPTGFSCRYNIRNYVKHKFGTHMLIMVQYLWCIKPCIFGALL